MTYPANLGLNIWNASQDSPQVPTNTGWAIALILSTLAGVAKGTETPPGSPVEGDFHILGATPTGAWSTFTVDNIAVFHNGGWVELTKQDRMLVRIDNGVAEDGTSDLYQYDGAGSPNEWRLIVTGEKPPSVSV